MENYFAALRQGFEGLRTVLSNDTIIVQLVAFSKMKIQLPLYMDTLDAAGYEELGVSSLQSNGKLCP